MGLDPSLAAVRLAVRRALPEAPATVLVACSGGADSLALLTATVFEAGQAGVRVVGVTVDHGLQEGSAAHAEHVVTQMSDLGVDETVGIRVTVESRGQGLEAAAREARYAVLEEVTQRMGAERVLLGHTLDDQAETVLLGLARGSGGRSIAGMRRGFDMFVRPLLDVRRAQTEGACRAQGVDWWDDPHNHDPRFTRSRVRHRVLPVLEEELGPGVTEALARTAAILREDADALDGYADRTLEEVRGPGGLDAGLLASRPRAVQVRVLRLAALAAGCPASELFRVHVLALADLARGPAGDKQVQLPGHVSAYRAGDWLRFRRTAVAG